MKIKIFLFVNSENISGYRIEHEITGGMFLSRKKKMFLQKVFLGKEHFKID